MINQNKKITFKLSHVALINLDSHAESKGMNRSEFIKYCITQEMERSKNEAEAAAKLNDFERLIQTILEVNNTANKAIEVAENSKRVLGKGILRVQEVLLALYPDNKEIEKIIYGEK